MRDYNIIYRIIDKLKKKELLIDEEYDDLVNILESAMGEYIPTFDEYCNYYDNIKLIHEYQKSINTVDLIPKLLVEQDAYNDKYHKGE